MQTLCSKMSIDNSKIVDAVGTEKDGTVVTLTVTDHLEWDCNEHLYKLQEKLNSYLAFIESGEVYASYPKAKGKKIKISVVCRHAPDDQGIIFLNKCRKLIENAGFIFTYETFGT